MKILRYIKKIEQFFQESVIGKDIVIVNPRFEKKEQDPTMNERKIASGDSHIGKDVVIVNPGNDKIYL